MATQEARPGQLNILTGIKALWRRIAGGDGNQGKGTGQETGVSKKPDTGARADGREVSKQAVPPVATKFTEPQTPESEKAILQEVSRIEDPSARLEKMSEFVEDSNLKSLLLDTARVLQERPSNQKIQRLIEMYTNFKRDFGYAELGDVFKTGNVLAQAIWGEAQKQGYAPAELQNIERTLAPDLGSGIMSPPGGGLGGVEQISSVVLSLEELNDLVTDPVEWFHGEWDTIDKIEQGPEDQGAQLLQQRLGIALSNMDKIPLGILSDDRKEKARKVHHARNGLYLMKHVLLNKNIDHARQIATNLGMGGLFYARGMVNGGVGVATNKLAEYVERERITRGNNVSATAIHAARRKALEDLLNEARDGAYGNQFGVTGDERVRNVNRAMLIGYNWFIASEQMAVHVAKGDLEGGYKQIVNEPFTYLAALYRMLEFSILKWEFLSDPQMAIVRKAFEIMGNGDIDKGRKRFDRMISVNDLFSSNWRIEPIVKTIDARFDNDEGKFFALGMRLKLNSEEGKEAQLRETWKTVATVRPLEVAKLMKEKVMGDEKTKCFKDIEDKPKEEKDKLRRELQERKSWKTKEDPKLQEFLNNNAALFGGITTYSQLEQGLRKCLYPLYADMMRTKHHIDFAHLTTEQRRIVTSLGGDPGRLSQQVVALSRYANHDDQINRLMERTEFYNRTLFVDDVPFEVLEEVGKLPNDEQGNEPEEGPLSSFYSIGGGEEPYPRIFNDTYMAMEASKALVGFIQTRDMKQLAALASAMNVYVSPETAAKAVHNLASAYFSLAKSDSFFAWTSLDKLPIATSEMQRQFGQKAESLDPAEMRKMIDEVNTILGKYPALEEKFKEIAGTSDITLIFFMARWDIMLILAILMKELFEQAMGQNK